MRVGMICPYSLTIPGGVQAQVLGLARALRHKGIDVRVLAPCDGPPPDPGVTPLGASLPTAANGSVAPLAPDPAAQLRVIRALRDEEFDVLHVHEPLAPGPTITAIVLKQTPIVATYHRSGDSRAYTWFRPLARWVSSRVEISCVVSELAAETARAVADGPFEMVFNGVELRGDHGPAHPTEGPTIVFVGRHEQRKGLSVLLEAMGCLPADVRLWVLGEGPETAHLRAATAGDSRIEWCGLVDDAEKRARLRGASVFCAPSLQGESFGVVLLEAMAAGTAVVASQLPGYAMVARPGLDALMTPPGDARALAEALRCALYEPGVADALVASGTARAESFSMDHLAERYITLYEKAASLTPAARLA